MVKSRNDLGSVARLVVINDPVLEPLLRADDAARDREVERLIVEHAQPLVAQILSRYAGPRTTLPKEDAEDVAATVSLRLVEKLRRLAISAEDAVENFAKYVATVTFNIVTDRLRTRFPERTRLKNRLRYVLTHDPRLSLWMCSAGPVCGLKSWNRSEIVANAVADSVRITRAMRDRDHPADAMVAILMMLGHAVSLDALAVFTAEIWGISDARLTDATRIPRRAPTTAEELETHQFLRLLWREITLLAPMQRKALLLNLRDGRTVNVISLLIVTGTAPFDDLAAVLEMSPSDLAAIWNDLPLDDLRIAGMLKLTRQQVINLRKTARVRLARRMGQPPRTQ